MGGAARVDVQSLLVLRPLSVVMCAVALLMLKQEHFVGRKWLFGGYAAVILLCLLHLIPLPPALWQSLPGREIIVEVDKFAGLSNIWRPQTLTPMNGWNAFFALLVPLAVLLLGIQLDKDDLYRLLPLLIGLGVASGLLGVLQTLGDPSGALYLYRITNNGSAVGLFSNRNHSALLLACLFPMLAVSASLRHGMEDQQRVRQLAAIAIAIVLVPLILVTGSRAGILVAVPALAAAALLYQQPRPSSGLPHAVGFQMKTTHIIAAVVVISLAFLTISFARAVAFDRLFENSAIEDSRSDYWRIGLQMAWSYFPFGSSSGSFVEAYQMGPATDLKASYVNHLHNDWLEIFLTMGVPGIAVLFGAIIAFALGTLRVWRRKDANRRSVRFARLASVLIGTIAAASVGDYPLRTPIMITVFAIACLWFTASDLQKASSAPIDESGA